MGQNISGYQPELALRPGTYRIASKLTNTAIQVSERDHSKIVAWETHDRSNQQWFVQSSGDGYKFKNCQHGSYLAVAGPGVHSLAYASRFPTTWVLLKVEDGYMIQCADNNNRVLDLRFGWGHNGNEIHIWPASGDNANRIWKFEHLSDDTGEELPASFQEQANRLTQDLHVQTQNSARKDEIIASLERDAEGNRQLLAKLTTDLAQKDQELVEKNKVIRQLQQGAKDKEEAVSRVGKEDEEMLHLRKQQVQLEIDLSQQKVETASLQGKMDRVEYLMARMSRSYEQA